MQLQVLEGCNEISPGPSLFQAKQAQFPQPFLMGEVLQPSEHLSGPPLDPLKELHMIQLNILDILIYRHIFALCIYFVFRYFRYIFYIKENIYIKIRTKIINDEIFYSLFMPLLSHYKFLHVVELND